MITMYVFVPGIPAPQGSVTAIPYKKADGSLGARRIHADSKTVPWREKVERHIREEISKSNVQFVKDAPIGIFLDFFFPVPQSKVKKKTGYPKYPTTKPDIDKLGRAICDSFMFASGIDDSVISTLQMNKKYVSDISKAGVEIYIKQSEQEYEKVEG